WAFDRSRKGSAATACRGPIEQGGGHAAESGAVDDRNASRQPHAEAQPAQYSRDRALRRPQRHHRLDLVSPVDPIAGGGAFFYSVVPARRRTHTPGDTAMTPDIGFLVPVRCAWNAWRTAEVRLTDLHDIHWFQPPGAPRPLVHAYVDCTKTHGE